MSQQAILRSATEALIICLTDDITSRSSGILAAGWDDLDDVRAFHSVSRAVVDLHSRGLIEFVSISEAPTAWEQRFARTLGVEPWRSERLVLRETGAYGPLLENMKVRLNDVSGSQLYAEAQDVFGLSQDEAHDMVRDAESNLARCQEGISWLTSVNARTGPVRPSPSWTSGSRDSVLTIEELILSASLGAASASLAWRARLASRIPDARALSSTDLLRAVLLGSNPVGSLGSDGG